jgi:hypothetical protein
MPFVSRRPPWLRTALLHSCLLALGSAQALGLQVEAHSQSCPAPARHAQPQEPLPLEAATRIPDSQAIAGGQDIAWVWLGEPTRRYPHGALGSPVHAGSVSARVRWRQGAWQTVEHRLSLNRVFEDRVPRLIDLDRDGRDEIVLIEADTLRGAALVVLGVDTSPDGPRLVERARSPFVGSSFRWLNPVGVADFDGDGHLDLSSVTTPHIGGVLLLHHYRPPALVPFARALDVSNHRMGALEQELAVIVPGSPAPAAERPTVILPDMTRRALHALRWDAPGQWTRIAESVPLPGLVERLTPLPGGACAVLANGSALRVSLAP